MSKAFILITRFVIACLIGTIATGRSQEVERKGDKSRGHPARIQEAIMILNDI